jgi:hypothetical protein
MRPALLAAATLPILLVIGCQQKLPADPVPDPKTPIMVPSGKEYPSALRLVDSYTVFKDDNGKPAPTDAFTGPGGSKVTLAQFAGKPFILYLWNQMFSDSVAQLSDLDALAGSGKIAVVSLNTDNTIDFPDKATPQLAALKLKTLVDYRDPNAAVIKALGRPTGPVAVLYDSRARQVLQIRGTGHYSSPEISALFAEAK